MAEPQLQPPGVGVPLIESFFLRYMFMPAVSKITTWDEAHKLFLEQTDKIIGIYQTIKPEHRAEKVLIPRLMGLEDSSRYWSANMTLEHVMIVTQGVANIIESLGQEKIPQYEVRTADVKPRGGFDDDMIPSFWEMMHDCADRIGAAFQNRNSEAALVHPWFGPLNTHGWHCLLGIHSGIHRRQLQKIAIRLG